MAQQRQARIEVKHYRIEAEVDPRMRTLSAKVLVEFVPQDEYTTSADFELNNALNLTKVSDETGRQVSATRSSQNFSVNVSFAQPLEKGKPASLVFEYNGRLTGEEDSPVFGISLPRSSRVTPTCCIRRGGFRWPATAPTGTRWTCASQCFALQGDRSWNRAPGDAGRRQGGVQLPIHPARLPRQPGDCAGDPVQASSEGVTTWMYFHDAEKAMTALTARRPARRCPT